MPIYNFKCDKCSHEFEKIVKMDTVQVSCPKCNTLANKQLSAPGGFLLKGNGWYKPSASSD